jgi:hypothetical protein
MGTRLGEVKGPMYENVPLIDVRTGVLHYPGAGHTSVMTGGVRIGSCACACAEEEREVLDMLEAMEVDEREGQGQGQDEVETEGERETEDVSMAPVANIVEREREWEREMPHLPSTPVRPLPPHLFDHRHNYNHNNHHAHHHAHPHHRQRAQGGYAYTTPPSSPVHVRRPTLVQFEPQPLQPLQPPIQLQLPHGSPVQHRRLPSHLANEYLPHHSPSTGTFDEPTPKTRRMYGYHPAFPTPVAAPAVFPPPQTYSPSPAPASAIYCATPPPPLSPAPYMAPAPGYPAPPPGPYAWYDVGVANNAYAATPVPDATAAGYGHFRPPSVAALAPPIPPPSFVEHAQTADLSTYSIHALEAHLLKDPAPRAPSIPTLHPAPTRARRGVRRAVGVQPTLGLDGEISTTRWETPEHSGRDPIPTPIVIPTSIPTPEVEIEINRPASVPPDTMEVEVEVEVETERAGRKRKREGRGTSDAGGDCDGDGSSEEGVLSSDERKRARIGLSRCAGLRRRSFGDDKKRPGSAVRFVALAPLVRDGC